MECIIHTDMLPPLRPPSSMNFPSMTTLDQKMVMTTKVRQYKGITPNNHDTLSKSTHDHHFHASNINIITKYEVSEQCTWVYKWNISYQWVEISMDGRHLWGIICRESWTSSLDLMSEMWIMEKMYPLVTPRSGRVTFRSNMGTCAHHRCNTPNLIPAWICHTKPLVELHKLCHPWPPRSSHATP